MDYQAYYRKVEDGNYQAYYDAVAAAEPRDPQATARTRDADGTIPGQARERMFNIAGEIQNTACPCRRFWKVARWSICAAARVAILILRRSSWGLRARSSASSRTPSACASARSTWKRK